MTETLLHNYKNLKERICSEFSTTDYHKGFSILCNYLDVRGYCQLKQPELSCYFFNKCEELFRCYGNCTAGINKIQSALSMLSCICCCREKCFPPKNQSSDSGNLCAKEKRKADPLDINQRPTKKPDSLIISDGSCCEENPFLQPLNIPPVLTYICTQIPSTITFNVMYLPTDQTRIILRCYESKSMCCHKWPPSCELRVNTVRCNTLDGPYDISSLCRVGTNQLQVNYDSTMCCYFIAQWMDKILVESIIDKVNVLDHAIAADRVRESFVMDLNSDVVEVSRSVSLIDLLSSVRIQIPARGVCCNHLSCFDLKTWLLHTMNNRKFECPICKEKICLSELIIDSYFQNILHIVESTATEVSLLPDGSWVVPVQTNSSDTQISSELQQPSSDNADNLQNESLELEKISNLKLGEERYCETRCKSRTCNQKYYSEYDDQKISVKQLNKDLEQKWINYCFELWKKEVKLLIHLKAVKTDGTMYWCVLCGTGKMSITTLMGSHILGKKHLVLQAKNGINWKSKSPSFKYFKCKAMSDNRYVSRHVRHSPPHIEPHLSPKITSRTSDIPLHELEKFTLPHVIPTLRRDSVNPIDFYTCQLSPTLQYIPSERFTSEPFSELSDNNIISSKDISQVLECREEDPMNNNTVTAQDLGSLLLVDSIVPLSVTQEDAYSLECKQLKDKEIIKAPEVVPEEKSVVSMTSSLFSFYPPADQSETNSSFFNWGQSQQSWVAQLEQHQQHQPD